MNVKKEHLALLGVLLLLFGIELIVIQRVVLTRTVSSLIVTKFYPPPEQIAFMVKDSEGNLQVRPITVEVPDRYGHCIATGGLVLILCCFIQIKPD